MEPRPARDVVLTSNRPLVIAHRGNSSEYPENTLPAFESAAALKADLTELDYHTTADGIPVVLHDKTLDRTTNAKKLWGGEKLAVAVTPHLGEDRLHGRRHAHHRPHRVVVAVAALTPLLVGDRVVQREVGRAGARLERLLRLPALDRALERLALHRGPGRARHAPDVLDHVGREPGRAVHLHHRGQIGEGLDAVAPVHRELLHGRRRPQLLDDGPGDIRALLQHRPLDARHQRRGQTPGRHLVLLHHEVGLALDVGVAPGGNRDRQRVVAALAGEPQPRQDRLDLGVRDPLAEDALEPLEVQLDYPRRDGLRIGVDRARHHRVDGDAWRRCAAGAASWITCSM